MDSVQAAIANAQAQLRAITIALDNLERLSIQPITSDLIGQMMGEVPTREDIDAVEEFMDMIEGGLSRVRVPDPNQLHLPYVYDYDALP